MTAIGIIIPDRGDRPDFMANCYRQLPRQTMWSSIKTIRTMNAPPEDDAVDITKRYRQGYELISEEGKVDIIAFMENDDWYSPAYLEIMVSEWEAAGKPDLFGPNFTMLYHLKLRKYFKWHHEQAAMAMDTLIRPGLDFKWGLDHDPYADSWLWNTIPNRKVWYPKNVICVGMKHGVGKCGGKNHIDKLDRFDNEDNGFLQNTLDEDSFEFFDSMSKKLREDGATEVYKYY